MRRRRSAAKKGREHDWISFKGIGAAYGDDNDRTVKTTCHSVYSQNMHSYNSSNGRTIKTELSGLTTPNHC